MEGSTFPGSDMERVGRQDLERQRNRPTKQANKGTIKGRSSARRACNECRQQKLRCDIVQDPFVACSRCRRFELHCRIDNGFKRVEKRKAKANQQQAEPRNNQTAAVVPASSKSPTSSTFTDTQSSTMDEPVPIITTQMLPTKPVMQPHIDLADDLSETRWSEMRGVRQATTIPDTIRARRSSYSTSRQPQNSYATDSHGQLIPQVSPRKLDGINLGANAVQLLFEQFFTFYHPYLPFLNPQISPNQYFQSSRLLFWAIISVASRRYTSDLTLLPSLSISIPKLLWSTLQGIPRNHHDVKAMCILCTWPFPMNSSSLDSTFILSGAMTHTAMQIGLHRPGNAQDFFKFKVKLSQEDLEDRVKTWATCNIVLQRIELFSVATGYGQPSMTVFDWALLSPRLPNKPEDQLCRELDHRLRIEKLSDRITKALYYDSSPTFGGAESMENIGIIRLLDQELVQLETELSMNGVSNISLFYHRCATLHLRLYVLLGPSKPENIISSLLSLYDACRQLLSMLISSDPLGDEPLAGKISLLHCPNYVFQMTLAASFSLLKMLRSSFREYIDVISGKALFNSSILAVRKMSIANNDLPGRLAEVLAQLWAKGPQASETAARPQLVSIHSSNIQQEIQLNVRGRMSMSVMFDSLLEWRKGFEEDASREASPKIRSRQEVSLGPQVPQQTTSAGSAIVSQEGDLNPSLIPQEWTLDEFPYDDSFYPLNWMVDSAGETHDIFSRVDQMEA